MHKTPYQSLNDISRCDRDTYINAQRTPSHPWPCCAISVIRDYCKGAEEGGDLLSILHICQLPDNVSKWHIYLVIF